MERKLHNIIMLPSVSAVLLSGGGLFYLNWPVYLASQWFRVKISAIVLLIFFQLRCYWHMQQFRKNNNIYTRKYFIPFNDTLFNISNDCGYGDY